jgi:hypothetical protein
MEDNPMGDKSAIEWNDTVLAPEIPNRSMQYFLVAMKEGKPCFGAYYLNNFPLQYEDGCPDADDTGLMCSSCEEGDGHLVTGWFNETGNSDESMYDTLESKHYKVIAWAHPPAYVRHVGGCPKCGARHPPDGGCI